jgi:hypothetical protein
MAKKNLDLIALVAFVVKRNLRIGLSRLRAPLRARTYYYIAYYRAHKAKNRR